MCRPDSVTTQDCGPQTVIPENRRRWCKHPLRIARSVCSRNAARTIHRWPQKLLRADGRALAWQIQSPGSKSPAYAEYSHWATLNRRTGVGLILCNIAHAHHLSTALGGFGPGRRDTVSTTGDPVFRGAGAWRTRGEPALFADGMPMPQFNSKASKGTVLGVGCSTGAHSGRRPSSSSSTRLAP